MDLRVPLAPILGAFGLPITVTVPAGAPVESTGVWLSPQPDTQPTSPDVHRPTNSKILAMSREASLSTLPRGTLILAPETLGGVVRSWRVVGFERAEVDTWRALVVPA